MTGLGLDEYFMRSEPSGTMSLLTDALGSTIALTDLNGDIQTEYTYGPFGRTTENGVQSSNPYRFTGREWEPMGTGMYFMRERYMMPLWGRFLSRDPMGFGAGSTNLYTYAGNSPTNFTDRLGLIAPNIGGGGGGDPCGGDCLPGPIRPFMASGIQGTITKIEDRRPRSLSQLPRVEFDVNVTLGIINFSRPLTRRGLGESRTTIVVPPQLGAGLDLKVDAPAESQMPVTVVVGLGRNGGVGTFLVKDSSTGRTRPQGLILNFGVSISPAPVGVGLPPGPFEGALGLAGF